MNGERVINGLLPWDGSHLGKYDRSVIKRQYLNDGVRYTDITLDIGKIYCIINKTKGNVECMVDEIKNIFGVNRRGTHRIILGSTNYIMYYVTISSDGKMIFDIPLSKIEKYEDKEFAKEMRKVMVFCEILGLSSTTGKFIRIRNFGGKVYPVNWNHGILDTKMSVIPKNMYEKWFGESITTYEILKEMIGYSEEKKNLCEITSEIRGKIDEIVKKYDKTYIWYSNVIIERISRCILSEGGV